MLAGVERIQRGGTLFAIVVRSNFEFSGVNFVTNPESSQQIAYMRHDKGKTIPPHYHNDVRRVVHYTREVLIIRRGSLKCDLYDDQQQFLESVIINQGDLIALTSGGHGFVALTEIEMIEIKQGPYAGADDKTHFSPT